MAALLIGALVLVATPAMSTGTSSAICKLFRGDNCDNKSGANGPNGTPTSGTSGGPPSVPGSAEQAAYDKAKKDADAANTEASNAEKELAGLKDELWSFLKDLIGITEAEKCIKDFDIMACIETAANAIPWGKALKLLRKLPKAFKLAGRFKSIWDKVSAARKKRDDAQRALKKAEDDLRKKKEADDLAKGKNDPACPTKPRAFGPRGGGAPQPVLVSDTSGRIHYLGLASARLALGTAIPCKTPEEVDKDIDDALKSDNVDKRAEAELADKLRRSNCRPNQFSQNFGPNSKQPDGDIDVGVPGAIIEVYNGAKADMGNKGHQATKFRTHPEVNPDGKRQVIFYAPNVSELDRKRFQEMYKDQNIRVFGSMDHLTNHLRRTGAC